MSKTNYYYQTMAMAEYALEGHNQRETAEEFEVTPGCVRKRINALAENNPVIYKKVMDVWHKNDNYEGKVV